MFDAATLRGALRPPATATAPRSRLVSVEQTTNLAGGRVWPLEQLRDGRRGRAKANGLRLHMDGARLMNAVVASGVPAAEWTAGFDTAWIDFTKGLGAPVGAVLAGSRELIDEAWRYKQMIGGALRQAGIVAAGALYALDHHVERLAEDHDNARTLARGLAEIPGIELDPAQVETNIVDLPGPDDPAALCAELARERRAHGRARRRARCARSPTSTSTRRTSRPRSRPSVARSIKQTERSSGTVAPSTALIPRCSAPRR